MTAIHAIYPMFPRISDAFHLFHCLDYSFNGSVFFYRRYKYVRFGFIVIHSHAGLAIGFCCNRNFVSKLHCNEMPFVYNKRREFWRSATDVSYANEVIDAGDRETQVSMYSGVSFFARLISPCFLHCLGECRSRTVLYPACQKTCVIIWGHGLNLYVASVKVKKMNSVQAVLSSLNS